MPSVARPSAISVYALSRTATPISTTEGSGPACSTSIVLCGTHPAAADAEFLLSALSDDGTVSMSFPLGAITAGRRTMEGILADYDLSMSRLPPQGHNAIRITAPA